MLPINYLAKARQDFDESARWYAARSEIAAMRFVDAVDAAISQIASKSQSFPVVGRDHRECRVKGFPFRIIFRQLENQIVIVAVAHAKRRPNFWQGRS